MSNKRTVIHRDRTFHHNGELFHVTRGGDYRSGFGWEIWRDSDGASIEDDFDTLRQVRDWVDWHRLNGWPMTPVSED